MPDKQMHIAEAEALEREGRFEHAMGVWVALARQEGASGFLVRGALAAARGNLKAQAEQLLDEVIRIDPSNAEAYFQLGIMKEEEDRLPEARQFLEAGVAIEQRSEILTILGSVQRRLGDLAEAEKSLLRSLEIDPSDDEAHYGLALVLSSSSTRGAITHFRRALEIDPSLPNADRQLGHSLWKAGELDEAELSFRRALALDPSDAWCHNYLGHLLRVREAYGEAKIELELAAQLEPSNGFFWASVADVYDLLGLPQEAERSYIRALSVDLYDPQVNARFGLFLKRHGYLTKARSYLRRAVEADPHDSQSHEALEELERKQSE